MIKLVFGKHFRLNQLSEVDQKGFDLEYSETGTDWIKIGKWNADGMFVSSGNMHEYILNKYEQYPNVLKNLALAIDCGDAIQNGLRNILKDEDL
jgi:hypothetical protein